MIDDFLSNAGLISRALEMNCGSIHRHEWIEYSNDFEAGKRVIETVDESANLRPLFEALDNSAGLIRELTGVADLEPTRRCGGLHITDPGGWLNCHLDAALYPCGRERRANVVLFMNLTWPKDGGGEFELYDDEARNVVAKVLPKFNRAVVWEASDLAYHGVAKLAAHAPPRVTAAVYFLAKARPGCVRRRAMYVPNREKK